MFFYFRLFGLRRSREGKVKLVSKSTYLCSWPKHAREGLLRFAHLELASRIYVQLRYYTIFRITSDKTNYQVQSRLLSCTNHYLIAHTVKTAPSFQAW